MALLAVVVVVLVIVHLFFFLLLLRLLLLLLLSLSAQQASSAQVVCCLRADYGKLMTGNVLPHPSASPYSQDPHNTLSCVLLPSSMPNTCAPVQNSLVELRKLPFLQQFSISQYLPPPLRLPLLLLVRRALATKTANGMRSPTHRGDRGGNTSLS